MTDEQPDWVCRDCGIKYSLRNKLVSLISTWHDDICGVCGKSTSVTEPRDFGYLRPEWKKERKQA
jgi:hypothetical protein